MLPQSRLRLLLAATFVSIAVAQQTLPTQITAAAPSSSARSYPPCSADCLAIATGSLQCPGETSSCLCAHQDDVRTSVEQCLAESKACSSEDAASAASYYETVCKALGLDANGQPFIIIPSGGLATATGFDGLGSAPTSYSASEPTSTPTSTSSSSENAGNQEQENSDNGDLSIATVAGIAVGATFVVIAIISGLIWMYIRHRDDDEEITRQVESQSRAPKPGFESSTTSFKGPGQKTSEKVVEYALTEIIPQAPPKYTRSSKPTIAERRNHAAQPLHHPTRSAALNNSSYPFPFGDRKAAEESVTSLALPNSASKPVSAIIVQQSPARSLFSDQASIYSVSSFHSEEAQIQRASELSTSRPTTFYNLYSGGAEGRSNTDLLSVPQQHSTISRSQSSLKHKDFDLRVESPSPIVTVTDDERDSINPFTTPPKAKAHTNPFISPIDEPEVPFDTPVERPNPLRLHPSVKGRQRQQPQHQPNRSLVQSGSSFGKFDFEIDEDYRRNSGRRSSGLMRNSFFKSLDLGLAGSSSGKQ